MSQHQPPRGHQHVEPVDPVIQSVEPELRFLLGLLTQLPSQFRDFRRQLDPGFLLWLSQLFIPVQATVFFRSGTRVQADLLTSDENMNSAGALRSTGVTPLHRYYGPLRLPTWQNHGYGFPQFVDLEPHPGPRSPSRVSQVPGRSFDACHPVSPRGTHLLHLLVASQVASGFALSGRLTIPTGVTRPKGSLALRLTSSRSRASTNGLPRSPPGRLHGERASAMVSTFQLTRSTKLRLTHRIARINAEQGRHDDGPASLTSGPYGWILTPPRSLSVQSHS